MKIILLDLDGTALSDRKIIEPETRRILQQCHSNGILSHYLKSRHHSLTMNSMRYATMELIKSERNAVSLMKVLVKSQLRIHA